MFCVELSFSHALSLNGKVYPSILVEDHEEAGTYVGAACPMWTTPTEHPSLWTEIEGIAKNDTKQAGKPSTFKCYIGKLESHSKDNGNWCNKRMQRCDR